MLSASGYGVRSFHSNFSLMASMASRYLASPVALDAAMKPEYSTLEVQMRSKCGVVRASCQSATLRSALSMSAGRKAGDRSVASGPPSTGASPKWRLMSLSTMACMAGVGSG